MFIDVGDAKLFATRTGTASAPAVVAVGGWIGSSELWTDPLALLSDEFCAISYDHRGSGVSQCAVETITFDNLVADLFSVLDHFEIERCTVAAESAGALTAIAAALKAPERIERLVIVDGMTHRGVAPDADPFLAGLQRAYEATLERFVQLCIPEDDAEHIKQWGRQIIRRAAPEAAIALRLVGSAVDLQGLFASVHQPTLVIHGELDPIVTLDQATTFAAALPHAEMHVLSGAGHVPTLTQPGAVADHMRAFLRSAA